MTGYTVSSVGFQNAVSTSRETFGTVQPLLLPNLAMVSGKTIAPIFGTVLPLVFTSLAMVSGKTTKKKKPSQ